ncbi:MAG: flagellin [Phycisphaeraceae bacterium]|nr:flagellin [Phycisphaeraceae bacterium]
MARINSNIPSMIARANLNRANKDLEVRLQRLSTGLQINRGADNPAGLIISERLRSEVSGLNQAVANSERASSVIATTEGSLAEVSDLLNSIKSLVVEAANTGAISNEERAANQLQIDSAIETITRISNSASFGGLKLLNGELDYVLSGVSTSAISKAQIHGANFAGQRNIQVNVQTVASAQTGSLFLRGDYASAPAFNGTLQSSTTLEIAGVHGVQTLEFLSGTSLAQLVSSINSFSESTGVSASLINPGNPSSGLVFSSTGYGSASFVSVKRIGGPVDGGYFATYELQNNFARPAAFSFSDPTIAAQLTVSNRDEGRDISAIVNGTLASGRGTNISLQNSTSLSLDLSLSTAFATRNSQTSTFYITGGGALYQLGGEINTSQQVNIGVQSVAASRLGGAMVNGVMQFIASLKSGGANDLRSRNFTGASTILDSAIDEVAMIRGRLGAFEKNTLQTNVRSVQAAIENLTASESNIRDADFAKETSALTRSQILTSAGTSVLSLANQQSQQVLQLLRG